VPCTIAYPRHAIHEAVMATARRTPNAVAYEFLGTKCTYGELGRKISQVANAFAGLGMRKGDRITIALPTCPQAVVGFYAASSLGVVPAMIHPLSTAGEVDGFVRRSGSRFALALTSLADRFAGPPGRKPLQALILTDVADETPLFRRLELRLLGGRTHRPVPADMPIHRWRQLVAAPHAPAPATSVDPDGLATILFSGGTTGTPKGILLSHRNLISQGLQIVAWAGMKEGDRVLATLPLFHGFGLSAVVNAALLCGADLILVPRYSPRTAAHLIRRRRPQMMAGVPSMYDALCREPAFRRADLSCFTAVFSGGDSLPASAKARFEQLARSRGGQVKLLEGYGLTEAVTGIMAMPRHLDREGSVGIPFPDTLAIICEPGTDRELPAGESGEICIAGPTVMMGYLDDPAATAAALKVHADGRTWLHTGDIGRADADGFFYFLGRLKRMIKSSGFNVFPAEVEAALSRHPAVAEAYVVGLPDEAQGQRVKAFVIARATAEPGLALGAALIAHCRERLIKWSCPREIEFRREFPRTRIGKVDERALLGTAPAEQRAAAAGPFSGKVVWITGASSGIGRALAIAFARAGARLVLSARRLEALQQVEHECPPMSEVRLLPFDLADLDGLTAVASQAQACFGVVDIMVHNAGVAVRDRAAKIPRDVHEHVLRTNYLGPVLLTQALLPGMIARGSGRFVVISSLSGKYAGPLLSAYAASKHALHGFFETLRGEEREHGIAVTMVIPGFIRTEITAHALTGTGERYGKVLAIYRHAMTAEQCAARTLRAIERNRKEVLIGGTELATVYLQRWFPSLLSRMVWSHPVKARNRWLGRIPVFGRRWRAQKAGETPPNNQPVLAAPTTLRVPPP
jgi:long-chain acyl-CoA synthetase